MEYSTTHYVYYRDGEAIHHIVLTDDFECRYSGAALDVRTAYERAHSMIRKAYAMAIQKHDKRGALIGY